MDKIVTVSGSEFDCDYLATIPIPAQMYIRVLNADLPQIANVFCNPAETGIIRYGNSILREYSKLIAIVPEGNAVKVILAKEG